MKRSFCDFCNNEITSRTNISNGSWSTVVPITEDTTKKVHIVVNIENRSDADICRMCIHKALEKLIHANSGVTEIPSEPKTPPEVPSP